MEAESMAFQTFEDLEAYKAARDYRCAMYGVSRRLPEPEKFGLASQIRRAAVSSAAYGTTDPELEAWLSSLDLN